MRQRNRTQTGIEVQVELGFGEPGLGVGQTGKLFGASEQKLDLEARLVIPVDRQRVQVDICAQEHGPPVVFGVDHEHHAEVILVWHVIEDTDDQSTISSSSVATCLQSVIGRPRAPCRRRFWDGLDLGVWVPGRDSAG